MSDERETPAVTDPGAPVEELNTTNDSVQDAVDRATAIGEEPAVYDAAPAEEISAPAAVAPQPAVAASTGVDVEAAIEEAQRRQAISEVDTQVSIERPELPVEGPASPAGAPQVAEFVEMPSAAAVAPAVVPVAAEPPVRDGEIRISPDHPMASLYMQTPTPPDLKGNRGAGALIALVATLAFAVLYAGMLAVWLAPAFPPSTFLTEGMLPWVTSWGFIAAVVAFYVGMLVLVLIFGRAGWWAYVIFSLFVGVLVWFASTGTFAVAGTPYASVADLVQQFGASGNRVEKALDIMRGLGFALPTLGAAVLAREVAVWFGAWIGSRGRKVRAKNAELLAEYETALAEVQAQK